MTPKLKILHLEDIPADAELVSRTLQKANIKFEKLLVDERAEYVKALRTFKPDVILSDHSLPAFNSREALELLKESGLNIPFILVTATVSEEFAVNVMREGAADYILKDRMQRLPNAVINAVDKFRLEAESQNTSQELQLLFNTIDEVFFSIDMINSKLIQISPACEKVYGYSTSEFLENPQLWYQVIHPDDKQIQEEGYRALLNGETVVSQYRIIHKDQSIQWLESKVVPSLGMKGTLVRIDGVSRDITERKKSDATIEQNHIQLLQASKTQADILNALPPNIVLLNEFGKIIAVNESWKKLVIKHNLGMPNYGVGYSYLAMAEKAIGADSGDVEKIALGIDSVVQGVQKEFTMEYPAHSSAEKRWFQLAAAPLADDNYKGAVVLHIDVTDRKLAEGSLIQSEANLRSVFENTDLSIVLFDSALKIMAFNRNANELINKTYRKKLKVGTSALDYFPKERKPMIKQIKERAAKREKVEYEASFKLIDGATAWYDVKWMGVDDQQNQNVGIIVTLSDISGKKQADMERDLMTADLTQRNKDLEQFTYIVSHNLRAPVANIIGLTNLLLDVEPDSDDTDVALKALSLSVNNLDQVILDLNQMLQVSSQVNAKIERISLISLMEEISSSIDHAIQKSKTRLTWDFTEIDRIYSLKSYLYSIIQNLVVNSIKYHRPNVPPEISVTSKLYAHKLAISVKDNGKGIDLAKNGGQLFGLYKRFDYSVEGKGMGLFMVKTQVESLNGSIGVKSEVNVGTEFLLELPLKTTL